MATPVSVWSPNLGNPRPMLVTNLYECCLQLALGIVKSPGPTLTSSSSQRLRTQVQKLSLWGSDFDVSAGYLRKQLLGADRLSNTLLSILEELAGTLITLAQHFPLEDKLFEILLRAQNAKRLASEAVSRPTPHRDDDGTGTFTVDELSSSGSEDPSNDEVDQLEDLIKDVQFHNDCLYGLGPVLHNPAEKVGYLDNTSSTVAEERGEASVSGFARSHELFKPEERSQMKINRSKWASEQNVGQEELYVAAEEVLNELRGMKEYSDLLTQVNRTEVPENSNVIKHPMDLEIMAKKLDGLVYKSKQDFVEDLDLIWQNCRKYDVNPERFGIRASYTLKETKKLVRLIPNIVIRDRAHVEAVERRLQSDDINKDGDEDSDDEPIMFTRKLKAPIDRDDSIMGIPFR